MTSFTKRSEILSNLLYIGAGDFGSRVLSFGAFIYVARVLGPDKLGLIGFVASACALAIPFVEYGLGFVGTRVTLSSLTSKLNLGYNAGWFACLLCAFNPINS
jgi:O-antigen/teichoic acid export membrane protein